MLDEEQRKEVMKMFNEGRGISEIAKKIGVSRQSVYRVIRSDFEEDTEIHDLKKQLRKAELNKQIQEVSKPLKVEEELGSMEERIEDKLSSMEERMKNALGSIQKSLKDEVGYIDYAIDGLFCWVLGLRYQHEELKGRAAWCVYCDADLEFHMGSKDGKTPPGYRCNRCNKNFFLP